MIPSFFAFNRIFGVLCLIYILGGGGVAKSRKEKEDIFISELIKGKSQRKAYLKAYPHSKKWKERTVDSRASELFLRSDIQGRYNQLRARLQKEIEDECIVDAKEIIKEYKKIAFADIKEFLEFKTEKNMVDLGAFEYPRYTQTIQMKDSKDVDGTMIQEVSINSKGVFTFKLHSKMKALEKLAEYVGLSNKGGEGESARDDGLSKQVEKLAKSDIWKGFENDE